MTRKSIDGEREKNPVFHLCVYDLVQHGTSSAERLFHASNEKAGILLSLRLPLIP